MMDTYLSDKVKELTKRVEQLEKGLSPRAPDEILRSKILAAIPKGYDNAVRPHCIYNHEDLKEYDPDLILSAITEFADDGVIDFRMKTAGGFSKTWIARAYYNKSEEL